MEAFYEGDYGGLVVVHIVRFEGLVVECAGLGKGLLEVECVLGRGETDVLLPEVGGQVFLFGLSGGGDKDGIFSKFDQVHDGGVSGAADDPAGSAECFCEEVGGEVVVKGDLVESRAVVGGAGQASDKENGFVEGGELSAEFFFEEGSLGFWTGEEDEEGISFGDGCFFHPGQGAEVVEGNGRKVRGMAQFA